jgi:hypothetical protein
VSRKFTERITADELAARVGEAVKAHSDFVIDGDEAREDKPFMVGSMLARLTPTVEKDLAKVEFDTENVEYEDGEGYSEGETGFRVLPNGLAVLGVTAGGDWQQPLYFVVYWDGLRLRGYIPTDGNPWNTKTKKAYGNDEDLDGKGDEENCKKRFGVDDYQQVDIDQKKVDADIQARITYSGK